MTRPPALIVDARAPYGSGLGRYLRESVVALSTLERFREIVLVGPAYELDAVRRSMAGSVRVVNAPRPRYDVLFPLTWGRRMRASAVGPDAVTWFPHWDGAWRGPWDEPPPGGAVSPVTTIHDLIPLEGAGLAGRTKAMIADRWIRRMLSASRVLVTVSAHSRHRFLSRYPEARGKLRVIHNGVAAVFTGRPARGSTANRWRGSRATPAAPYLLCVANKKPHKRLEIAIQTLARLSTEEPALRLVLIGERFDHVARLRETAERCGVSSRVDDLVGVSDDELADWYAGATAVLVPSREEGFGMVALEAMACGAPVIAVAHPPMPEVVGEAAVLVSPGDDAAEAEAIAAAVRRIIAEPAWRGDRIAAGQRHAAQFTWARSASALADALLFPGEPR